MNLQDKIKRFEGDGWTYEHNFMLPVEGNTLIQFMALTKNGYYRKIENGKIGAAKQYMSDRDIEDIKNSWGGAREGAGRKSTGRKKKNYYVTDEEDRKIRELIEQLRKPLE